MTNAAALLLLFGLGNMAVASVIGIGGQITQSTQDGTGPAINNPALNSIADGDAWMLSLVFDGSISAPGTYNDLANASLIFSDPGTGAIEAGFSFISLTISEVSGVDQFSLLGCLNTGSACAAGNQLSASFEILAANLNAQSTPVIGLDPPHPLDLLEDDGVTDIQGSITSYSYATPLPAVPEPSTTAFLGVGLTLLAGGYWKRPGRRTKVIQRRSGL